ncbi:MAG: multidrug transporter MatE [Firmicutes bacterium]|nr:multidrug transporter MatE [Bacillota bacterium]
MIINFGAKKTFISSKYFSLLLSGTVLMMLTAVMGVVDTLIAGIMLGEYAVDGVCLVLPLYSFASFIAVIFSYGVPILYAGKMGAYKKEEADKCFGVGLTMVSAIGILMFLLFSIGGDAYLKIYHSDARVYSCAAEYLYWVKYVALILPLNELFDGILFADGDEKLSLTANLIQGITKIFLSVVLCRNIGVKGLAIASFISLMVSILISCIHFFSPGNTLKPNIAFSPQIAWDILKYSIVDGSTHLFVSLFNISINFFVIKSFGFEMLILVSVITLLKEGQILFEGIGEAITPLISTYIGEENYPGIKEVWNLAQKSLLAESLLMMAFAVIGAPFIVSLLGIQNQTTAVYAIWGLRILSLTLVFTCRLFLDSSYFILVDKISLGIFDSFLRDLFPAFPLAVLGGKIGGIYGMFIGLMAAPPIGYLLSVLYIKYKYGSENYPLFLADMEKRKNVKLFEFEVLPDKIVNTRDEIGKALEANSCNARQIDQVMLLFEELFMLIYDNNPGKTLFAECMVEIGTTIRLITKDNGKIIDLTDTDQNITSFRSYILSNLLEAHTVKRVHFLTLSYNRNIFEIKQM